MSLHGEVVLDSIREALSRTCNVGFWVVGIMWGFEVVSIVRDVGVVGIVTGIVVVGKVVGGVL